MDCTDDMPIAVRSRKLCSFWYDRPRRFSHLNTCPLATGHHNHQLSSLRVNQHQKIYLIEHALRPPYMRQSSLGGDPQKGSMVTTLIVITIPVFVLQQVMNAFFPDAGGRENSFLTDWFALSGQNFRELKVWTILSYGLLHSTAGFYHILGNMLGLFFIGRIVEPIIGRERFLGLYLAGSLIGGAVYLLLHFNDPALGQINDELIFQSMVGASASLMAILAFFCLLYPERTITLVLFYHPRNDETEVDILGHASHFHRWHFILRATQISPYVAHSAHLGGMFAGILLPLLP